MSNSYSHKDIVGFNIIGGLRTTWVRCKVFIWNISKNRIWNPISQAPRLTHLKGRGHWWRALEDMETLRGCRSKTF